MTSQAMAATYTREQHIECLMLLDRIRDEWIWLFEVDMRPCSAVYWELLTYLWVEIGSVRKTDALRSIKSPHTAGKYVDVAVRKGMLEERKNPEDARSRLLTLAPQTKMRMDAFVLGSGRSETLVGRHTP